MIEYAAENRKLGIATCPPEAGPERRFVPESLTPLAHTAIYNHLTSPQRLRYNQLAGCCMNEQIRFFEVLIARNVLPRCREWELPSSLRRSIGNFMVDENRHAEMFHQFNRHFAPRIYGQMDFYFVSLSPVSRIVLKHTTQRPGLFPLWIWLGMLQEERVVSYSKQILQARDELDPVFVEVHRQHLVDEVHHVQWDEELLAFIWPRTRTWLRHFNARLFAWMIREFFMVPKRSGIRVVEELAKEFPELTSDLPEMKRQLCALQDDAEFLSNLYSRDTLPRVFAWLDRWPECSALKEALRG